MQREFHLASSRAAHRSEKSENIEFLDYLLIHTFVIRQG
jgi:hypothetical protein